MNAILVATTRMDTMVGTTAALRQYARLEYGSADAEWLLGMWARRLRGTRFHFGAWLRRFLLPRVPARSLTPDPRF